MRPRAASVGKFMRSLSACTALFLSVLICNAAQGKSGLVRIAGDVYAKIVSPNGNAVGNSGIVVLEHGVLVFDTHFTPEAGLQFREEIRAITSKPVTCIVNSHFHPDHTHGNQAFPDAQIIGSQRTRINILQEDLPSLNRSIRVAEAQLEKMRSEEAGNRDPEKLAALRMEIRTRADYLKTLSNLKISPPFVAMEDALTLQDGAREVQIRFIGAGHTDGDTILFLPGERIAFLGDLFFNDAVPNVQDARMLEWMETLEKALELKADRFIPGHGPVGTREDVLRFLGYFRELRTLVEPCVEKGFSLEQTMNAMQLPVKYSRYGFKNFFPANVQKMYEEIKKLLLSTIPIEGPQLPKK